MTNQITIDGRTIDSTFFFERTLGRVKRILGHLNDKI